MNKIPLNRLIFTETAQEELPFRDWFASLREPEQNVVAERIAALKAGFLGSVSQIQDNVFELKIATEDIFFVYFSVDWERAALIFRNGMKLPARRP